MVPVPAEHADEVMRYVFGLSLRATMTNWEPGTLETFISELSDDEAALVRVVNRCVASGRLCPRVELATELGLTIDAVGLRVQEMAERAWAGGLPALVLADAGDHIGGGGDGVVFSIPIELVSRVYAALDARVSSARPG